MAGAGRRRRERTVIATKVYGGRDSWPNTSKLSARHIREACEHSLRRLQTDYIDLYQMHHVDRDTPWEEIWQAMELLVQQGKVLYVGSSNFAGWHIAQANERAARRNFLGLVSEQSLYNLNARMIELEVLPACSDYGVGVIPWSPLGGGLLGGALQKLTEGRRGAERIQEQVERMRATLEAWEKLCAEPRCAAGRCGAGVAVAQPGRDGADHRPPHHRAARRGHGRARARASTTTWSPSSTASSPARVARLPRPTPGDVELIPRHGAMVLAVVVVDPSRRRTTLPANLSVAGSSRRTKLLRALDRLPSRPLSTYASMGMGLLLCAVAVLGLGLLTSALVGNVAQATLALPMLCFPAPCSPMPSSR